MLEHITENVGNNGTENTIDSPSDAAIISYSDPAHEIAMDTITPAGDHSESSWSPSKKGFFTKFSKQITAT